MAQDENRSKALNAALSQIERQFGKGTVMRLGDTPRVAMPAVSTGSLGLDIAWASVAFLMVVWWKSSA